MPSIQLAWRLLRIWITEQLIGIKMAQCEQCGNFDDQEIENDYGVFDLGKRPKRRKGYQPELYYYWHGDIEEDYQMPDGMCCMCEICFDIANTEGRIKWVDDKNPFAQSF